MVSSTRVARAAVGLGSVMLLAGGPVAEGQGCGPRWLPTDGVPGAAGTVRASVRWDPDGPGPRGSLVIIGGDFSGVENVAASRMAAWDPELERWSAFDAPPTPGTVSSLAVLPDGRLVAGIIAPRSEAAAPLVQVWNGSAWTPLGGFGFSFGGPTSVRALHVLRSGDLIAAGDFAVLDGVLTASIARWNGQRWSRLGEGVQGIVRSVTELPTGDIVVGGRFDLIGGVENGVAARNVAIWNGSTWSPLADGLDGDVRAVITAPDGAALAGGVRTLADGELFGYVERFADGAWTPIGEVGVDVNALTELPTGDLVAVGTGISFAQNQSSLMRWTGSAWVRLNSIESSFGPGGPFFTATPLPDGRVLTGGAPNAVPNLLLLDGGRWRPLGRGFSRGIATLGVGPDGALLVAGSRVLNDSITSQASRWDGAGWSGLGNELAGQVRCFLPLADGGVVAGATLWPTLGIGGFTIDIGRWDGTSWRPLGRGLRGTVYALTLGPSGELIAGGRFSLPGSGNPQNLGVWDGRVWRSLGSASPDTDVRALARLPNGDIVAGGRFSSVGQLPARGLARWNGQTWTEIPGINGQVNALAVMPSGELLVAGDFQLNNVGVSAFALASWDGTAWRGFGQITRSINAVAVLGQDDFVIAGDFRFDNVSWLARWRSGVGFTALVPGASEQPRAESLLTLPGGELVVGGWFTSIGGVPAGYFARWTPTGGPSIVLQPRSQALAAGAVLSLSARVPPGYTDVGVGWRRNGVDIADGPGGASSGGGIVSGAVAPLASPTTGAAATLTITGVQPSDSGAYDAVFSNPCGTVTTVAASVVVTPGCPVDFTADGVRTPGDLFAFVGAYFARCTGVGPGPCQFGSADFNRDGAITPADLFVFMTAYFAGC
jgi:trimeric autotransporter adhesin